MAAKALARFRSRCEQVRNYRLTPRDANSCEKIFDYFSNAIRINLSENLPDAVLNLIDSVAKKNIDGFSMSICLILLITHTP